MSKSVIVVVPCFNEEKRLDPSGFEPLFSAEGVSVLFVDDGSADRTGDRLREICAARPGKADLLSLGRNQGKGEAIRLGLLKALESGPDLVGYFDADLSTPSRELLRLLARIGQGDCKVVLGSRIKMLGTDIDRNGMRHLVGRVFATLASLSLGIGVYDTQCGAKLFANVPALAVALESPFASRWAFDVELIARLLHPDHREIDAIRLDEICEVPLATWRDVKGSKLGGREMLRAASETLRIGLKVYRRRSC